MSGLTRRKIIPALGAFSALAAYPAFTIGAALNDLIASGSEGFDGFTTVQGDGVTDKSDELASGNAIGKPLIISGVLVIGTPTEITVPIVDTMEQIFSGDSLITIGNGLPVRPEWWGNGQRTIEYAVNALPAQYRHHPK